MKNILFISLMLVSFSTAFASQKVEFTANKTHALLVFVQAISGQPNLPPHLKKVFEESRFNNDESKRYLEEFRKLEPALSKHFDFDGLPRERTSGIGVRDLISIQSAFSGDLKDFRQRILGLMNYADLSKLIRVLSHFEPIYDSLVWKPNVSALNKAVGELQKKSKVWKLDEMFEKTVSFYGSSWPKDQIFRVSFYPIPKEAELSNGRSFGAFESVGLIIGEKIEEKFGVVFHELCHSIYDAQSAEVQKKFSAWFMNSSSPFAPLTYHWINEALATALGNGWAHKKAKMNTDKKEWYHHEKIDGLAQALYPKVVEYLNSDRSIDAEFVNFAIKAFEEKFPLALREIEAILGSDLLFLTDTPDPIYRESAQELRRHFRIHSLNSGSPIDHAISKDDIRDNELTTLMFVVTSKNIKQLSDITDVLPEMKTVIRAIRKSEDQIGVFKFGKRNAVILVLQDAERSKKAIEWMINTRKFEEVGSFMKLTLQ